MEEELKGSNNRIANRHTLYTFAVFNLLQSEFSTFQKFRSAMQYIKYLGTFRMHIPSNKNIQTKKQGWGGISISPVPADILNGSVKYLLLRRSKIDY